MKNKQAEGGKLWLGKNLSINYYTTDYTHEVESHRQTDEAKSTQAQVTCREVEKGEWDRVLQIDEAEETKYETDTG